jgi:hypothetical protein
VFGAIEVHAQVVSVIKVFVTWNAVVMLVGVVTKQLVLRGKCFVAAVAPMVFINAMLCKLFAAG